MSGANQMENEQLMWLSGDDNDNNDRDYDSQQRNSNTEPMYREDLFEGDIG